MGKKGCFATGKSAKHYHQWFKGDERWNPSKVTKWTMSEEELATYKQPRPIKNERDV